MSIEALRRIIAARDNYGWSPEADAAINEARDLVARAGAVIAARPWDHVDGSYVVCHGTAEEANDNMGPAIDALERQLMSATDTQAMQSYHYALKILRAHQNTVTPSEAWPNSINGG